MEIIDGHNHLYDEPGYVDNLLRTMDELNISKCCVSGLGEMFNFTTDKGIKEAFEQHPDRIIGAVYIRPGVDGPDKIKWGFENGFKMVKVTLPLKGYESPEYFPLWQACMEYGFPILFHTGLVGSKPTPEENISSWNMHPIRIEPIAQKFPELNLQVAHLGVNWNVDAAELLRMKSNIYVDLSGEPGGWRERLAAEGIKKYLWWPSAFERVIFGTDVHYTKIKIALELDHKMHADAGLTKEQRENIFSGNFKKFMGDKL
jgi:predicted TIM-barrel fold metal-dependent hydrolase